MISKNGNRSTWALGMILSMLLIILGWMWADMRSQNSGVRAEIVDHAVATGSVEIDQQSRIVRLESNYGDIKDRLNRIENKLDRMGGR